MFDFVRSHTKLLQFLLVLLIFPSFVFFGIQGYSSFTEKGNTTVAKIGGGEIKQAELDRAHADQMRRMQQQMPNVDQKLFDTPEMKSRTLESLVRERVLQMAVVKENLVVTEDQLSRMFRNDPQFESIRMPDGTVNKEFLASQGLTSQGFARQLSDSIAKSQVLGGVSSSLLAGQAITSQATSVLLQQREVQVQPFMSQAAMASVNPTEADLEAYYKDHQAQFHTEEEARIEYVVLDLEAMQKQVPITEEELKKAYEDDKAAKYMTTEERRAAHILVNAPPSMPAAEREKAKAKATALLAEVRKNPASFGEVAKKNSDDPGSAAKGGDLDYFAPDAMVKPFSEAAYKMKPGEISDLVESEFGYHIIKLTDVRGGQPKPFETVRAQIFDEKTKPKAQALYAAAVTQFNDMVYEQSDSLQPVIDQFKLTKAEAVVQRKPKPGATGPLASPKLLEKVFSTDAIQNKRNTDAVSVGSSTVAAHVLEHHPERVQPLDQVRDAVTAAVKAQQATALAKKQGEERLAELKKDPSKAMAQPAVIVSRTSREQPREVVDAVLRADISKGPAAVGVDLGDKGFVVARVVKVVDRATDDPQLAQAKTYVNDALSAAETAAYYDALKRRYKVKIDKVAGVADAASGPTK